MCKLNIQFKFGSKQCTYQAFPCKGCLDKISVHFQKNGVWVGRKVLYAGRRVTELIQIVEYLKQTTLKVFVSNSQKKQKKKSNIDTTRPGAVGRFLWHRVTLPQTRSSHQHEKNDNHQQQHQNHHHYHLNHHRFDDHNHYHHDEGHDPHHHSHHQRYNLYSRQHHKHINDPNHNHFERLTVDILEKSRWRLPKRWWC